MNAKDVATLVMSIFEDGTRDENVISTWTRMSGEREEKAHVYRHIREFVAWNETRGDYAAYRSDGSYKFDAFEEAEDVLFEDGWKKITNELPSSRPRRGRNERYGYQGS